VKSEKTGFRARGAGRGEYGARSKESKVKCEKSGFRDQVPGFGARRRG